MTIYTHPDEYPVTGQDTAVCLGNFDGVHIGHRRLLAALAEAPEAHKTIVTFSPHPMSLLREEPFTLITPGEERLRQLYSDGIDDILVLPFDRAFMQQDRGDFLRFLVSRMQVKRIIVGFNYTFGYKGLGDAEYLLAMQEELGYTACILPAVLTESGSVASTTAAKKAIFEGDFDTAREILGRPYHLEGTVVRGKGLGSRIGIPTANFFVDEEQFLPQNGVFAVRARVRDRYFAGVMNLGTNPTFGKEGRHLEVHLINYPGDPIYGEKIRVEFYRFLRPEKKFPSAEALIERIWFDRDTAAAIIEPLL